MAAHRYWRAYRMEARESADLELSAFELLAVGVRVDAAATLTASLAPDGPGTLSALQDDDMATAARWSAISAKLLVLQWDFGASPVDVDDIRLAGPSDARFLDAVTVQWSDDAQIWTDSPTLACVNPWGIAWPGASGKTVSVAFGYWSRTDKGANVVLDSTRRTAKTNNVSCARAEKFCSDGIRQFEVDVDAGGIPTVGVSTSAYALTANFTSASFWGISVNNGSTYNKFNNGYVTVSALSFVAPCTLGVVVNFNTGDISYYRDGVLRGVMFAGAAGALGKTLAPTVGSSSVGYSTHTLRTQGFLYPVAGADPWEAGSLIAARSTPRTISLVPINVGSGPVISYGAPDLKNPALLTVESGSIKDYNTGPLGAGRGRVHGTVKEKGTPDAPVYRKVRLIRERDGLLIRELWSAPTTGAYSFNYIDELQSWAVMAHDHTCAFRDQIASNLTLATGGVELIP